MNPVKIRLCQKCKRQYTFKESRSRYCLICRNERKRIDEIGSRTLGSFRTNKNVHPSWLMSDVRQHCRRVNAYRPKQCQVCGYSFYVEHAHIKSIADHLDDVIIDDINKPSNVLILCPNHHKEFDLSIEKHEEILALVTPHFPKVLKE